MLNLASEPYPRPPVPLSPSPDHHSPPPLAPLSWWQLGSFNMATPPSGQKAGPPPLVKKVLSMFGSQREEDKMVGYLSFLKVRGGQGGH